MRVAWIGLGAIGRPMALAALRAGHAVTAYARRPDEHDAIRAAGGTVTSVLLDALPGAEVVCVNLFSEAQLHDVVIEGGVMQAMEPAAILVVHSTVSPGAIRKLGGMRPDVTVLDAGFSGGPEEALGGRLTLMVGGDGTALDRVRPLFAAYAGHVAHVGLLGSGMALKVINNLMFAANVAVARDALRLVAAEGVMLDVAITALLRGSAGSTALSLLGRGADPAATLGAMRPYLEKDVPIALASAGAFDLGILSTATAEFARPGAASRSASTE